MGQTQHTVGTANVRASCILLLATGNVGRPGGGANIFRGHDNVQGATDVGLDIVTLPFYYGLLEGAWRHWGRVWEVEYDWLQSQFDSKKMMESPGIPLTRWFDAVLLPKDQVDQKDNIRAMFVQGHASNSIVRIPESVKGLQKLELLVVADPHPTTWASLAVSGGRRDNTYLLPVCSQFESSGSRVASNRSIQWGEQIVKPIFESKDDIEVIYLIANKLGFADKMFKNIKVENNRPLPEDVLREMNRGSWSTGYCGQSPERLKLHMTNQKDFDFLTMRAKDGPAKGDYYGLPWPCWGTPEFKHPGTPLLYNTNLSVMDGGGTFRARFGVERVVKTKVMENGQEVEKEQKFNLLAEGSYSKDSEIKDGYPEFTLAVLKKLGWDKDLTPEELATIQKVNPANPDAVSWSLDLSGGIQRVAITHGCIPYGNGKARANAFGLPDPIPVHREPIYTPRVDLVSKYPTLPRCQAVPAAQRWLRGAEGRGGERRRQGVPAHPQLGAPGRVRRRWRGDALKQVARRAAAGHVHRDQSCRCRRARHPGWRLGVGDRRGKQLARQGQGAGDGTGRKGSGMDALPLRRLVPGRRSARQLPQGSRSHRARREREHDHDLRLRSGDGHAGAEGHSLSDQSGLGSGSWLG